MEALLNMIQPGTAGEWVFYTILWLIALVVVAKVYSNVQTRKLKEEYKIKHKEDNDAERKALKILMRYLIKETKNECVKKGYISDSDMEEVAETYETYKLLWGNSTGDAYFEQIKEVYKKNCQKA